MNSSKLCNSWKFVSLFTVAIAAIGLGIAFAQTPSSVLPTGAQQGQKNQPGQNQAGQDKVVKSLNEWRQQLNDIEFHVTRQKGTEQAFTGKLWNNKKKGIYTCTCCGQKLFDSSTKFKSGTGWPSYYQPSDPNNVAEKTDFGWGMTRTEVLCSRCDAHLGHVFNDGPRPTGKRYCINSASLKFQAANTTATDPQADAAETALRSDDTKPGMGSNTKPAMGSSTKPASAGSGSKTK